MSVFLPTGLIGALWPEATRLVRVEHSTSAYINMLYPGVVTG